MAERIVLVSDDLNFFSYILPKIRLRNSDEIYRFSFDELPDKMDKLTDSVFIINSENNSVKTLQLFDFINENPVIVFAYNVDEELKVELYKRGMNSYITPDVSDEELNSKIMSCFRIVSSLKKNKMYRELLVDNRLITPNNEVFLNSNLILDNELLKIRKSSINAVLAAIAPDEKSKHTLQPNQIETIILNNIRNNDILMNYAPNKYFLLFYNADIKTVQNIWDKIKLKIPDKIHAGFVQVGFKTRQQLVSEALMKLHENINRLPVSDDSSMANFKIFRQEFNKQLGQIIYPVFYQIQQMYSDRLSGIKMEQETGEGFGIYSVKTKYVNGYFKITAPGLSKINVDIIYEIDNENAGKNFSLKSKRVTLDPHEFESGVLQDLLERFIQEFKSEVEGEFTE